MNINTSPAKYKNRILLTAQYALVIVLLMCTKVSAVINTKQIIKDRNHFLPLYPINSNAVIDSV